jgi:hypothetical protein
VNTGAEGMVSGTEVWVGADERRRTEWRENVAQCGTRLMWRRIGANCASGGREEGVTSETKPNAAREGKREGGRVVRRWRPLWGETRGGDGGERAAASGRPAARAGGEKMAQCSAYRKESQMAAARTNVEDCNVRLVAAHGVRFEKYICYKFLMLHTHLSWGLWSNELRAWGRRMYGDGSVYV